MLTRQPMRRPFEVRLTFCAKTVVALVAAAGDKGNSSLELLRVAKIVVLCLTINNQLTQHRLQQRMSVRMFGVVQVALGDREGVRQTPCSTST